MNNRNTQSVSGSRGGAGTFELRKPVMPMHNREVIEFYTPHIQLLGVQAQRKEETEQIFKSISKGTYPYGGKTKVPTNGKPVKVKRYKFKPDVWNMDGQIVYEPPFKDPEESKKDFFVQVEENNMRMSKTKFVTMQKNIDKRKQLEEKDIKYGNAKPKPNYSGFSDDEDDLKQTKDSVKAPQQELSVKSEAKKPPSVKGDENKNIQASQVSQQNKKSADNEQKPQEQDNQDQEEEEQQMPEEEEIEQQDEQEQEQEADEQEQEQEEEVQPPQQQQLQKQKSLSVKDQKKPEIIIEKPQQNIPVQDEEEQQQEEEEEQQQEQDYEQEQEEIDQLQELSKSYASSQKSKGKYKSGAANMLGDLLSQV